MNQKYLQIMNLNKNKNNIRANNYNKLQKKKAIITNNQRQWIKNKKLMNLKKFLEERLPEENQNIKQNEKGRLELIVVRFFYIVGQVYLAWELAATLKSHQYLIDEFEEREKHKLEKKRMKREYKEIQRNGRQNGEEQVFLTDGEEEETKSEKELKHLELALDNKNDALARQSISSDSFDEEFDNLTQMNGMTQGSFADGDKLNEILCITAKTTKGLQMQVSWRPRKNGIIPGNAVLTNKEIFTHDPKALIKYYENKLRLVPAK